MTDGVYTYPNGRLTGQNIELMVVRIFKATVKPELKKEFENFFRYEAIPYMQVQEGLVQVTTGKPISQNDHDFVMITTWESIDAVRKFMDNEWNKDKLVRDEMNLLLGTSIEHYEIM